jgi:hypothetical protein
MRAPKGFLSAMRRAVHGLGAITMTDEGEHVGKRFGVIPLGGFFHFKIGEPFVYPDVPRLGPMARNRLNLLAIQ